MHCLVELPNISLFLLELEDEVQRDSGERNVCLYMSEKVASFSALFLRDPPFLFEFVFNPVYKPCMKQANEHFINLFFQKCRVNTLCASEQLVLNIW